jgi:hypothetical protein
MISPKLEELAQEFQNVLIFKVRPASPPSANWLNRCFAGGRGRVRGHRHGVQHLLDAHLRLRQEQPDDHAVQRRQLRQVEAAGAGEQVDRRRSRFFFIFDVL